MNTQEKIELRAVELSQKALTLIEAHEKHCAQLESRRMNEYAALAASVTRIHARIDSMSNRVVATGLTIIFGLASLVWWLITNDMPWKT